MQEDNSLQEQQHQQQQQQQWANKSVEALLDVATLQVELESSSIHSARRELVRRGDLAVDHYLHIAILDYYCKKCTRPQV